MKTDLRAQLTDRFTLLNPKVADKAVWGMMLLRLNRCGRKGIGPNRDDLPLFKQVVDGSLKGVVDRHANFRARHRVVKYQRQLSQSEYAPMVFSDEPIGTIISVYSSQLLESEVAATKPSENYGDW